MSEINHNGIKILEQCRVSPLSPPPSTTLPLTFFDVPFFSCRHFKRIFFYEFPHPIHHFLQAALPILKHSLSLSLQHFFPFASNIILPPQPHLSHIRYLHGDSLSFTVAESTADFTLLTSDSPQDVRNWHPLLPTLPSPRVEQDGTRVFPLMAIQVTVFPNSGFAICLTFNHVVGDGKSLHHFIKFWASLCEARGNLASIETSLFLPSHERDKVKDPKGIRVIYFKKLEDHESRSMDFAGPARDVFTNNVRFSVKLSREQVDKLKKWVYLKRASYDSGLSHVSSFVVTCTLIWVCMIRSSESKGNCVAQHCDELCSLLIPVDCRDLPGFSLPSTYFGNCVAPCIVAIKESELVGEDGIVGGANAIERQIRDFKSDDVLRKVERAISEFKGFGSMIAVAGSPKFDVYQTDFGWGKPKKCEAAHIESSVSISLSECREGKGGIEVGLALERIQMTKFMNILEEHLNNIHNL